MTFRIDKRFRPYADRIRINELPDTRALAAAKVKMLAILHAKNVAAVKAVAAVQKTLHAAVNHQLAQSRYEIRRSAARSAVGDLNELISILERLIEAISALPPHSKGQLNLALAAARSDNFFDTETFCEIIDAILVCAPKLSPKVLAAAVTILIEPRIEYLEATPRCSRLWESIPAETRLNIEQRARDNAQLSGIELLRLIANLLVELRPALPIGRPRSLQLNFVRATNGVWQSLGLKGRLRYDERNERHVMSPFQQFCNAALHGVGDNSTVSKRQISNMTKRGDVGEGGIKLLKKHRK